MSAALLGTLALCVPACGGSEKKVSEPTSGMGESGIATLRIPRVDPALCDTEGKKVLTFDLNRDDKPDVWKLLASADEGGTTVEILTCKQVDFDHDGRKDYVAIYNRTGQLLAEEFDLTFDGHFDARAHYDVDTGKIYLEERDTGHDGKPDVWEKYKDGVLESVKRDRNADDKPDVWEQYKDGKLVAILYDDNYDARVDRKSSTAEADQSEAQPTVSGDQAAGDDAAAAGDDAASDDAAADGPETEPAAGPETEPATESPAGDDPAPPATP